MMRSNRRGFTWRPALYRGHRPVLLDPPSFLLGVGVGGAALLLALFIVWLRLPGATP